MICVNACSESNESGPIMVQAPPLDARVVQACYDPGIGEDALVALGEHRVALASCRKRHQNVVDQYNSVRELLNTESAE